MLNAVPAGPVTSRALGPTPCAFGLFASVLVKLSLRDPTTDVSIFVIVLEIVGNVLR